MDANFEQIDIYEARSCQDSSGAQYYKGSPYATYTEGPRDQLSGIKFRGSSACIILCNRAE